MTEYFVGLSCRLYLLPERFLQCFTFGMENFLLISFAKYLYIVTYGQN